MATFGVVGGALLGGGAPLARSTTSSATTITANSTAHTKGAWTELIASTPEAATLLWVTVASVGANATQTSTLLDIAVGGAGAETAIASDIPIGGADSASGGRTWSLALPIAVAAGARISARIQSVVTGGKTAVVTISTLTGGSHTPATSPLVTMGSSTATSAGTVTAAGSWTQITASTAAAYRYLIPVPSLDTATAAGTTTPLEIGTGGAGNEVVTGSLYVATLATESTFAVIGSVPWAAVQLKPGCAAGARIAARGHADISCAVIGVP